MNSTMTPDKSCTILRIKRKRNEEPLEALIVESRTRSKKSRGGLDVFQFAQTVESDTWENEERKRNLQERIALLANEMAVEPHIPSSSVADATPSTDFAKIVSQDVTGTTEISAWTGTHAPETPMAEDPPVLLVPSSSRQGQPDYQIMDQTHFGQEESASFPAPAPPPQITPISRYKEELNRRYQIVSQAGPEEDEERRMNAPPRVVPVKELLPTALSGIKLYDAIPEPVEEPPLDPEMEKFMPMLQEYLKLHDTVPDTDDAINSGSTSDAAAPPSSSDDYVWDVFYRRPAAFKELDEGSLSNIATLTGLPPAFEKLSDSDYDTEEEDEADEDSNAEEYYKNDYPDEIDSDDSDGSDMFHECSEGEDGYDHPA